jgi:hypothetical protein
MARTDSDRDGHFPLLPGQSHDEYQYLYHAAQNAVTATRKGPHHAAPFTFHLSMSMLFYRTGHPVTSLSDPCPLMALGQNVQELARIVDAGEADPFDADFFFSTSSSQHGNIPL